MKFSDLLLNYRFVMVLYILFLLPGLAVLWAIEKIVSFFGSGLTAHFYIGFILIYMVLLCVGKAVWTDHGDKIRKRWKQRKQRKASLRQDDLWNQPPEKAPWEK